MVYWQTYEGFLQGSTELNVCLKQYDIMEIYEMVAGLASGLNGQELPSK